MGFLEDLYLSEGAYNWNKQAIALLIEISFTLTGFY